MDHREQYPVYTWKTHEAIDMATHQGKNVLVVLPDDSNVRIQEVYLKDICANNDIFCDLDCTPYRIGIFGSLKFMHKRDHQNSNLQFDEVFHYQWE
jgi:hypothetical protein